MIEKVLREVTDVMKNTLFVLYLMAVFLYGAALVAASYYPWFTDSGFIFMFPVWSAVWPIQVWHFLRIRKLKAMVGSEEAWKDE